MPYERLPMKSFTLAAFPNYRREAPGCSLLRPVAVNARLSDICSGKPLAGANDVILTEAPYGVLKLHFSWPGYGFTETVPLDMYGASARLTRGTLVNAAAKSFLGYMDNLRRSKVHASAMRYRVDPENITAHHITIVSIVNTFEDVWQLDMAITI